MRCLHHATRKHEHLPVALTALVQVLVVVTCAGVDTKYFKQSSPDECGI